MKKILILFFILLFQAPLNLFCCEAKAKAKDTQIVSFSTCLATLASLCIYYEDSIDQIRAILTLFNNSDNDCKVYNPQRFYSHTDINEITIGYGINSSQQDLSEEDFLARIDDFFEHMDENDPIAAFTTSPTSFDPHARVLRTETVDNKTQERWRMHHIQLDHISLVHQDNMQCFSFFRKDTDRPKYIVSENSHAGYDFVYKTKPLPGGSMNVDIWAVPPRKFLSKHAPELR